jgi:hypothetical protein
MTLTSRRFENRNDPRWGAWDRPVLVTTGRQSEERVDSPADALNMLANRWCGVRASSYYVARRQCLAFLKRKMPAQAVRDAFVAAANDAGLLASHDH